MVNLPEKDNTNVTPGSTIVNFSPEPGMMIFTNSWLPHSFTAHGADEPIQFVHFNLNVIESPHIPNNQVEII